MSDTINDFPKLTKFIIGQKENRYTYKFYNSFNNNPNLKSFEFMFNNMTFIEFKDCCKNNPSVQILY